MYLWMSSGGFNYKTYEVTYSYKKHISKYLRKNIYIKPFESLRILKRSYNLLKISNYV
jgi:hypothetical protein